MKYLCKLSISVLLLSVAFGSSLLWGATGNVKLIASGNGRYSLQAYDVANMGGLSVDILYQNMTNPRVQKGPLIDNAASPFFVVNPKIPGVIKLVIAGTQFPTSGEIATITFDLVPGKKGSANLANLQVADNQAAKKDVDSSTSPVDDIITADPLINNAGGGKTITSDNRDPGDERNSDDGRDSDGGGNDVQQGNVYLGRVIMPTEADPGKSETETSENDEQENKEDNQQEQTSYASSSAEYQQSDVSDTQQAEPAREPERTEPGTQKFTAHKGLLDQFREFKGELTPQALTALVAGYSIPGVRQEPPMALSDGKMVVKVYLDLPAAGTQSPNFALKGAKLVSLKNDEKGKWVIEALPAKNTSDVRITALQDNVMTEIPLTVVQPVPATVVSPQGAWDEATFALFLKDRGAEKEPRFDLNGDGTRSFIDDYIYTVNYVIRNPKATGAKAGSQQQVKPVQPVQPPAAPAVKPVRPK